jgi:type IV secretory pathway TrbF-like protein
MPVETHPEEGIVLRESELQKAVSAGKFWRHTTSGALCLVGILAVGCIYLGAQPKWRPYYVEIDSCGGHVRVVGPAPQEIPQAQLAAQTTVRKFVEGLRVVSTDQEITKQNWRALEHQTTQKGARLLLTYKDEYQPLSRRDPVVVTNVQVYPRTEQTYYVRWQELVYSGRSPQRERLSTTLYGGLFTIERRRPWTQEEREDAPLGVFFDAWSFQKEG